MSTHEDGALPHAQRTSAGRAEEADGQVALRVLTIVVLTIGGVFGLFVMVGAVGPAVYAEVDDSVGLDLVLPDQTHLPALRERSYVYAGDGTRLAVLHGEENREIVDLDDLPDHVWQAVVTAEDRRFLEHDGFDLPGISRAAVANLRARDITQGGSTITQQLAKNNFLDDSQTLQRKFAELLYAMALEEELEKEELLDRYINEVYFGAGAYGIQAAAEEYWGLDAADLEPQHSATLAGMIRAPGRYSPRGDPEGALTRRDRVLTAMASEEYLTEETAGELTETELDVIESQPDEVIEPFVVEAVKRSFLGNDAFGETRDERIELLFGGGLELHTGIELELQEVAREVIGDHFPEPVPTAAIASLEPGTGRVIAFGSAQQFTEEQYDLALQGRRQPGSAFKTFVMIEALRQGIEPDLELDGSSPHTIPIGDDRDPDWRVTNYAGRSFGDIDMVEATRRSVNTYYAQLGEQIGIGSVVDLTEELGFSSLAYGGYTGLSVAIGGLDRGVTPIEMASAYGTLGNEGVRIEPYLLERVVGGEGVIWERDGSERRVLDEHVNATAIDILEDAVEQGTGTAARVEGWEVAGKTGTTNDNYDAWFAGTTPALATAVWVGHPTENVRMEEGTGGALAAPLWGDFMSRALEGYEPTPFPDVDTGVDRIIAGEVDDDDGEEEQEQADASG